MCRLALAVNAQKIFFEYGSFSFIKGALRETDSGLLPITPYGALGKLASNSSLLLELSNSMRVRDTLRPHPSVYFPISAATEACDDDRPKRTQSTLREREGAQRS